MPWSFDTFYNKMRFSRKPCSRRKTEQMSLSLPQAKLHGQIFWGWWSRREETRRGSGDAVAVENQYRARKQPLKFPKNPMKMCFHLKCVKTSRHDRGGYFMSYHGLPYIISNLPKWTFTTLKDFRIKSCMWAGDMVYKFTLGMKHPVSLGLSSWLYDEVLYDHINWWKSV